MHVLWLIAHWFLTVTGSNNTSDTWYGFWSGFAGDLTIFAGIITYYIHTRCHVEGCNKRGKYPFKHYRLCGHHNPNVPDKVTHLHIKQLHKRGNITKEK